MIKLPEMIQRKLDTENYRWLCSHMDGWLHTIPHKPIVHLLLNRLACCKTEERYLRESTNDLVKENLKLSKKLGIAVKALGFYGANENWMVYDGFALIDDDYSGESHGKRARQALEEIKGLK